MISSTNTYEILEDIQSTNDFIESHPNSIVFQSNTLISLFSQSKNNKPFSYTLTCNSKIVGSLYGVIVEDYFWPLNKLTSRAIIIGGPLVLNNDTNLLNRLLEEFTERIKDQAIYTQFRNARKLSKDEIAIFENHGYKYEEHLGIIHDLTKPTDDQWMKLHKGRRKNIRRAERSGLVFKEIKSKPEFEESVKLIQGTYKRIGLPLPAKKLFLGIKANAMCKGILRTFIASWNSEIIATRMVLCYKGLIYDWYAGASNEHLDLYPNDFLPWKIIEWGSKNGFSKFDFGGAGKPNIPYGVRDHKLKFGGQLVEYGRFEKIHKKRLYNLGRVGLFILKRK